MAKIKNKSVGCQVSVGDGKQDNLFMVPYHDPFSAEKSVQNPAYNREQCHLATVGEVSERVF